MKRINIVSAAVMLLLAPLAAPAITISSPNGGETLTLGTTFPVTWTAPGVTQNVKLILLREDNSIYEVIIRDLAPGGSPYNWPVGRTEAGTAPAGRYKIRISTMDGGEKDVSNAAFAISDGSPPEPTPTIRVTSPNGGETWALGSSHAVTWSSTDLAGLVNISLLQGGTVLGSLGSANATLGSMPWIVGEYAGGTAAARSGYRFRVTHSSGAPGDDSNADFTIGPAGDPGRTAFIRDVRVSGASPYPIFEWVTVSWTASGITQTIDMELFRSDGSRVGAIYSLPAGTTSHGWMAGMFTPGMAGVGDYKIRVSTRDDALSAESAVFTLVAPTCPPSLYLNAPSHFDSWRPGSFHYIHWNIRGWLPNLVQLSLRREGAPEAEAPVLRLADGVGNRGEYGEFNWYIPPSLAEGRYFVRARVTATLFADSEVFAISSSGDPGATEGNVIWINADLALVGVGVEYYNGSIVAWVKNNGPDRLRSHWVKFRVSFPESGTSRDIIKELSIHVNHEEGVPLMELAARSIPAAGLRVIVVIEPSDVHIRDSNRLNQHRDVRIFAR